jgi:hypothetical protein
MIVLIVLGVAFLPFNKFSIADMTKQMGDEDQGTRTKDEG